MTRTVLTRDDIERNEGVRKRHFLNDRARRVNKSLGDLTGLTGFGFHIVEIEPGCHSTELHVHHHEDECVYVLSGDAEAVIGDRRFEVQAGDFIAYPAGGEPHKLVNTGDATLRCIVVGQRLDHDVVDYPERSKRMFRNPGLPWNLVDHEAIEEPDAGRKA